MLDTKLNIEKELNYMKNGVFMIKLVLAFLAFVVGIPLIGFVGFMAVAHLSREFYRAKDDSYTLTDDTV